MQADPHALGTNRTTVPKGSPRSLVSTSLTEKTHRKIEVVVRVRPLLSGEGNSPPVIEVRDAQHLLLNYRDQEVSVKAQQIFPHATSQAELCDYFLPWVRTFLEYTPCSIMAYGHTGSGKTYTMYGEEYQLSPSKKRRTGASQNSQQMHNVSSIVYQESPGLVPRLVYHIFLYMEQKEESSAKETLGIRFYQIYNEKIYDLLDPVRRYLPRLKTTSK